MLGKIVCGDLVNPFESAIILPFGLLNYTKYRSTKALRIANIVQLQQQRNSHKPLQRYQICSCLQLSELYSRYQKYSGVQMVHIRYLMNVQILFVILKTSHLYCFTFNSNKNWQSLYKPMLILFQWHIKKIQGLLLLHCFALVHFLFATTTRNNRG